jgi:hypothetical protein
MIDADMSERESWNDLRQRRMDSPAARATYDQARSAYEIGRMVRDLREARGLSQSEVAERMGHNLVRVRWADEDQRRFFVGLRNGQTATSNTDDSSLVSSSSSILVGLRARRTGRSGPGPRGPVDLWVNSNLGESVASGSDGDRRRR